VPQQGRAVSVARNVPVRAQIFLSLDREKVAAAACDNTCSRFR
jgi:hypothetical protein